MSRSDIPRLHLVTDDAVLHRPDFHSVAAEVMEAGEERLAFHVRGPGSTGAQIHKVAGMLAPLARGSGSRLLVNDRVDVALTLGLNGVHLPQHSLPAGVARGLLGSDALIGVSTHDRSEVDEAAQGGADYVFVGAIFETASHPGAEGRGLDAVSDAVEVGLPVIAIGGVAIANVADVLAAGAAGVAVIGGVWGTPHPRDAVIRYLDALDGETGES